CGQRVPTHSTVTPLERCQAGVGRWHAPSIARTDHRESARLSPSLTCVALGLQEVSRIIRHGATGREVFGHRDSSRGGRGAATPGAGGDIAAETTTWTGSGVSAVQPSPDGV